MAQNLGNIYVSINARLAKLKADLKKAEAMSRASGMKMNANMNLSKAKKGLSGFNTMLTATFAGVGVAAVARFTKSIVSIGAEFEHSMLIVKGVTRATGKQFTDLTDLAKKLGETTEWTAQQAAGGLKFLGMAGLGAERSLEALPGMLDLATAGSIELATAADIATNAMTAMQIPVEELSRVNDVFIGTITRSNTNMEMMAESFKYSAPLAKAYGVSIETLAAMIGTLGNAGIQGSMAGTQLAFAFQKTQKVFEALGMDGKGKSFIDALRAAKDAGWGAAEMMKAFGMRGGRAALVLKDLIPMIENLEGKLNNSEGEARKLAETMRSSTKTAFIELKSAIEGIAISAFTENTGGLNEAVRSLTETVRASKDSFIEMAGTFLRVAESAIATTKAIIEFKKFISSAFDFKLDPTGILVAPKLLLKVLGEIETKLIDIAKRYGFFQSQEDILGFKTGELNAQSVMSDRERRRLGLDVEDTESKKRGPSFNQRAPLTDLWNTGPSVVPRMNASDNIDWAAQEKNFEDAKTRIEDAKKLNADYEQSKRDSWEATQDIWLTKANERSDVQSRSLDRIIQNETEAAELSKVPWEATKDFWQMQEEEKYEVHSRGMDAIIESERSGFEKMRQLSERTAWAMQDNFSSFFYDAMKGELTSLKDLATSVFDSILKAFADMAAQMAVQKLFGVALGAFGGGGSSPIDAFIGNFMHEGGKVGESGTKAIMPASLFNNAPRLHGGLAADEFPAILQKGETVIPKNGGGEQGMVINQNPNITIVAQDASSFVDMTNRNPGAILAPIMQAIQEGNMPLINAIRGVI